MIRILDEHIYSDGLKLIAGACVDADVTNLPTIGIIHRQHDDLRRQR